MSISQSEEHRLELHVSVYQVYQNERWQQVTREFPVFREAGIVYQGGQLHPGVVFDQAAVDQFLEEQKCQPCSEAIFLNINEANETRGVFWLDVDEGVTPPRAIAWELKRFLTIKPADRPAPTPPPPPPPAPP